MTLHSLHTAEFNRHFHGRNWLLYRIYKRRLLLTFPSRTFCFSHFFFTGAWRFEKVGMMIIFTLGERSWIFPGKLFKFCDRFRVATHSRDLKEGALNYKPSLVTRLVQPPYDLLNGHLSWSHIHL